MPVRRVAANEQVAADQGRVAIQRGPIVYAAEWKDNPGGKVRNLMLPDTAKLTAVASTELNGVTMVRSRAVAYSYDAAGKLQKKEQEFTAIPYYTWANRGRGEMMVWIPSAEVSAVPAKFPTLATTAKVTTSGSKNPQPINDDDDPRSSRDGSYYFDWWPQGTGQGANAAIKNGWVEYAFEKAVTVSESQLYWFDDTPNGGVRVPASWRILYRVAGEWKQIENSGVWPVEKDKFNLITFKPVVTTGLRLEVDFQPGFSAGIQRWRVR
jgi:hypothetical protein